MAEKNYNNTQRQPRQETAVMPLLFSEELEVRVLTSIINDNSTYFSAATLLQPELFHNDKNRRLFKVMLKGLSEGKVVDTMFLSMKSIENPDPKGYTMQEIIDVFGTYYSTALFAQDLNYLRELAKRRKFWLLGQKLIRLGVDMSYSSNEAMREVAKTMEDDDGDDSGVMTMKDANAQLMEHVNANVSGVSDTFLETGFKPLDDNGGFQRADFDVIAADSSMGKTALATNIMMHMAAAGNPCMSFSMEMMAWQLAARINAHNAGTPSNIIQYKKLAESQYQDLQRSIEKTDSLPIYFDDKSTTSVDAIMASIRLNSKKLGIKCFVIDYLQILSSIGYVKDEEKFLGGVSRRFKNLAKELNVNITVLSQLARNNQDPRPTLARVRASGQIVEAADTVLLIWRPSMYGKLKYNDSCAPVDGTAEIIIGKGRNIGTGSFIVHFDPATSYFQDATEEEREAWGKPATREASRQGKAAAGTPPLPDPITPKEPLLPF